MCVFYMLIWYVLPLSVYAMKCLSFVSLLNTDIRYFTISYFSFFFFIIQAPVEQYRYDASVCVCCVCVTDFVNFV